MPRIVRMLETAPGAPAGHTVFDYVEGEVYGPESEPAMSDQLAEVLTKYGLAVEVDEDGNPIAPPAAKRQTKPAGPAETK
jgi:hypothetical protein